LDARQEISDKITPTLYREIQAELAKLYEDGRKRAVMGMIHHDETAAVGLLPEACPYSFDDVLRDGWYPEPEVTP
ncbi:MAG: DUF29 family protein, partial [Alphaproteobacteria bacterium]|nr:DUF29 family protein [Alphaproteobacteria bacterium]